MKFKTIIKNWEEKGEMPIFNPGDQSVVKKTKNYSVHIFVLLGKDRYILYQSTCIDYPEDKIMSGSGVLSWGQLVRYLGSGMNYPEFLGEELEEGDKKFLKENSIEY